MSEWEMTCSFPTWRKMAKQTRFAFLSVFLLFSNGACKPHPLSAVELGPPEIVLPQNVEALSPSEAGAWLSQHSQAVIVDVRTETEFKEERLAGAKNFDYLQGVDNDRRLSQLDHQQSVLVYCALGGRSKAIAARMSEMGFSRIVWLKGGLDAWAKAGQPLQK